MKNRKPLHDDWGTPDWLLEYICNKYFGGVMMFDPCPLYSDVDGLKIDWKQYNYINPPYNRKDKEAFILKAYQESLKGKMCVMLLPVSTSTKIFHDVILPNAQIIEFLKGRVKFYGYNSKGEYVTEKCGQHDSMIVVFNGIKMDNKNKESE